MAGIWVLLFTNITLEWQAGLLDPVTGTCEDGFRAYGIPLPWHASGVGSLSRWVYWPGMLLSLLVYGLISPIVAHVGFRSVERWGIPGWGKRVLSCALLFCAVASAALYAVPFFFAETGDHETVQGSCRAPVCSTSAPSSGGNPDEQGAVKPVVRPSSGRNQHPHRIVGRCHVVSAPL